MKYRNNYILYYYYAVLWLLPNSQPIAYHLVTPQLVVYIDRQRKYTV